MPTVYFVCIGNTCRSPMAAAIFNQVALERGIEGIRADSFGIAPFYDDSDDVRQLRESAVCKVMGGVDGLSNHRPKGIEDIAFKEGDKIVLLDSGKIEEFADQFCGNPSRSGKRIRMCTVETKDPFGGTVEDYVHCCQFLKGEIEENFGALTEMTCS